MQKRDKYNRRFASNHGPLGMGELGGSCDLRIAHKHRNETKPWNMMHSLSSFDSPRFTGRQRSHRNSVVEQ